MKNGAALLIWTFLCLGKSFKVDNAIESCLFKILKTYFPGRPILLITDLTIDREPFKPRLLPDLQKEYHREFIGKIMAKRKWTLQIYNTDKYIGLPAKLRLNKLKNCFFFIRSEIIASDVLFRWEMDRLRKNPMWSPAARNLIVVNGENLTDGEEVAKKILDDLWTKSKAVDTLVMIAESGGDIMFYTWFPYRQPDCETVKNPVPLDIYRNGKFIRKGDLFPLKLRSDLENCSLTAATETCIPYVFADPNNASRFVSGVEVHIVDQLSSMLNFRLKTRRIRNIWTTRINKSLAGAFKLLAEQKIDLAFSCLMLNRERFLLAQALPSYYEDSLVWFVPSPSYRSHASDIFYSFPVHFWTLLIVVMAAGAVLVISLAYAEHSSADWSSNVAVAYFVKLIGMSLYAPTEIPTKRYSTRLFVFIFYLYSMHVTIGFQASLFALYRNPQYSRFYSSLEQAVDEGLLVYLRSSSPELYNQSDHALWNKILRPGHHDYLKDFGEVFSQIAYEKTAIALYIKTTGIYMISVYFTDEFGRPEILWLRYQFAPYPLTIYMSPGHPLFPVFENRVYRLLASGLVSIWLQWSVLGGHLHWSNEQENNILSLKHLGGPFLFLLSLLYVALMAFIGELFVFYCLKKGKKIKKKPAHRFLYPPNKSKLGKSNTVTVMKLGKRGVVYIP